MEIEVAWLEPGILRVVWPDEIRSEDVDRFTSQHDDLVRPVRDYVILHEARSVPGLNAAHRRQLANWVEHAGAMHNARCRGACFVAASPVARAIVTGMWWLISTPYPHETFETRQPALDWARAALTKST